MKVLGQGDQDIKGICKAAVEAGVKWLIYEDESGTDGMQSAKIGRDYLRTLGY
jgi:sugar phosphate isomerase/epimerase